MLSLINSVSGRPWAIRAEIAAHVRGLVARDGIAGLRQLAELRSALRADDDHNEPRAAAGARRMATSSTVAVIPVIGVVTQRGGFDAVECVAFRSVADIADEVRAAAAEPKVDAIVLEVDSPGGEVFGVPEAFAAIKEASKLKPIVAAVNSVSASAAYWISVAATEIWVTPSGQVGSIGVFALHVDMSKALEMMGEKWTFVSAGKYKTEGNPTEELGSEARSAIQADVDRYYSFFVRDVAKGRGVSSKTVQGGFGEGRMVAADQAVEQKMADRVGTFEQAIRRAAELGSQARRNAARAEGGAPVVVATAPRAGINLAPSLGEGDAMRSCAGCEYYRKPSPGGSSGACKLYDFTAEDGWVCDSWEPRGEPAADPEPAPEQPTAVAAAERGAALARLRGIL